MLVTCTGAHAEAAPLARTETGARAVCCQPARGEQTVLVARIGRDLPCARASKRAFAPLCVAATRNPTRKLLRGRQSPPRYTRSRAAGRRRCVLKNRRPSLVIASGRGGRPHCARQLPSKSSPGGKGLLRSRLRRALAVAQTVSSVVTAHTRCRRAVLPASALQSAACAPGMFKRCAA